MAESLFAVDGDRYTTYMSTFSETGGQLERSITAPLILLLEGSEPLSLGYTQRAGGITGGGRTGSTALVPTEERILLNELVVRSQAGDAEAIEKLRKMWDTLLEGNLLGC